MSVLRLGRRAMGTFFEVVLCGDDRVSMRAAAEEALAEVERLEEQLSIFLPTSELSRLNARAAGQAVPVEPALFDLLARSVDLHRRTGGAFDVAVGPLMAAWGFRNRRAGGRTAARRRSGSRHLRLEEGRVRFARPGVSLDLGGIGKGYALDRAAAILRRHGLTRAFLHGGTSTACAIGAPPGEDGWTIGLVDPRDPTHRLGTLTLSDGALSASSGTGRGAHVDGEEVGHVIDPRTGEPVGGACAWAVGASAADTDALATAFLVLGAEEAAAFVARNPGTGAMVLEDDLVCAGVSPVLARTPREAGGLDRRVLLKAAAATAAAFTVGMHQGLATAEEEQVRPVRVAVVGLGEQGLLLLDRLARMKGAEVAAVCDTRPEALEQSLSVAGRSVETYKDYAYMFEEEGVEAIVVATPTHRHADVSIAALEAGAHVFCEAPLARTVEDCKRIARSAAEHGRVFQIGHQRRASALYPHAYTHIESGALGTPLQLRSQWNRKRSWRRPARDAASERERNWRLYRESSGGLLLEQGSHVFDLAQWFFGDLPEAVTGFGSLLHWKDGREVDDSVQVVLRYPGGRQVNFGASLVNSYGDETDLVVGDAASILVMRQRKGLLFKEADAVAIGWEQYAKAEMLGAYRGIVLDAEATKYKSHEEAEEIGPDADKADYHAELEGFLAAVRGGKAPVCGVLDGMRAAVVAIAAGEAVAQGEVIEFTDEHFEV